MIHHMKSCGEENSVKRSRPKQHICAMCGKQFTTNYELNKHVEKEHQVMLRSGESFFLQSVHSKYMKAKQRRVWPCNKCCVPFSKSSSLKKHMYSVHVDEFIVLDKNPKANPITFNCFHCDEMFSNLKQLKDHKKKYPHQKCHFCIQCGKVFKNKKVMSSHVSQEHSGQVFKCLCKLYHSILHINGYNATNMGLSFEILEDPGN